MVRCGSARCGPSRARSRPATRRCRPCRRACRGACRTGRCAGTGSRFGQAHDQLLQDADLGVRLHDPDQPEDRGTRHHAVGIEHEHVIEARAVPLEEVPEIAGLVAVIVEPAPVVQPVGHGGPAAPAREGRRPRPPRSRRSCVSLSRKTSNAAASPVASRLATVSSRCRITRAGSSLWTGITRATRAPIGPRAGERSGRQDIGRRIAAGTEDREADHRVPKADHVPGQHGGEAAEQDDVGRRRARRRPARAPSRPAPRAWCRAPPSRTRRGAGAVPQLSVPPRSIAPNPTGASTRTHAPDSICRSEMPSNREARASGDVFRRSRVNRSGRDKVNGPSPCAGPALVDSARHR